MSRFVGEKIVTKAIHKKYVSLAVEIEKAEAKNQNTKAKELTLQFQQMQNDYPRLIGTLNKKW